MDKSLRNLLGILDEGKREYRFVSGEVTQEEYEYGQLLDALLFGEGGYVQTLGPTWDLIHDTRFSFIENAFIATRRAVFGGDASIGKQYISSDGQFTSQIADLDEYATVLGEGRYFYYILTHPYKECPLRNWYLRIFPEMVHKDGLHIPKPGDNLLCACRQDGVENDLVARNLVLEPDDILWALIKQECPNYFNKEGVPNGVATRLFDLFKADLLGLIADYAVTPISDVYIALDTGDILGEKKWKDENNTDVTPHVFLEVDILERALTQRAVLRATAAKILRQMGFQRVLKEQLGGDIRLTDFERDTLLRIIYEPKEIAGIPVDPSSNWYGFLHIVEKRVLEFLVSINNSGLTFEERNKGQLSLASAKAHDTFEKLASGEIEVINQFTEPEVDVQLDSHAEIMQAILRDPLKQELFMMWVEAEKRSGDDNKNNTDRLNMHRMYSVLTPIFIDPNFVVDEAKYTEYMAEADNLGMFTVSTSEVEGEYHGTFETED